MSDTKSGTSTSKDADVHIFSKGRISALVQQDFPRPKSLILKDAKEIAHGSKKYPTLKEIAKRNNIIFPADANYTDEEKLHILEYVYSQTHKPM